MFRRSFLFSWLGALFVRPSDDPEIHFSTDGNVGMNTPDPSAKLDISPPPKLRWVEKTDAGIRFVGDVGNWVCDRHGDVGAWVVGIVTPTRSITVCPECLIDLLLSSHVGRGYNEKNTSDSCGGNRINFGGM